jgi:hypothetical protein
MVVHVNEPRVPDTLIKETERNLFFRTDMSTLRETLFEYLLTYPPVIKMERFLEIESKFISRLPR